MVKIGLILSGCGVNDGAEIHESVVALLALDREGAEVAFIAPDKDQMDVVNHLAGEAAAGESRNVLIESARIARGNVRDIATVKASLVACYFMHLISEKKLIYFVLVLTVAFFVALLLLPVVTSLDPVEM